VVERTTRLVLDEDQLQGWVLDGEVGVSLTHLDRLCREGL
jgi:hypothetical protein